MMLMIRTQVQFTQTQLNALRQRSSVTGRSVADLIREGVEMYLNQQIQLKESERKRRAIDVVGRFASGRRDGSAEHDRHLAEAFNT